LITRKYYKLQHQSITKTNVITYKLLTKPSVNKNNSKLYKIIQHIVQYKIIYVNIRSAIAIMNIIKKYWNITKILICLYVWLKVNIYWIFVLVNLCLCKIRILILSWKIINLSNICVLVGLRMYCFLIFNGNRMLGKRSNRFGNCLDMYMEI
jgi:hypothetical protein